MWEIFSFILSFFWTTPSDEHCRKIIHHEVNHIVCSFQTDEISANLFHKNKDGAPFEYISNLENALKVQNTLPLMIMNGGMYHVNLSPVGLYIEDGKEIQKISKKSGWGNFHLLPNGVFWIDGNDMGVEETFTYINANRRPDFATQSGPMLLINGKLHPKFQKASTSTKIRNGVGLSKDKKTIYFAVSQQEINFWNFATLFRDQLNAHDALFLDGTVSAISTESYQRSTWHKLGIFIGIFAK